VPLEALSQFEGQRIDPLRAAALKASLKGGGKDPAIAALESNFDVLRKEYEDARSLGEVSPELEQEYRDTRNELLNRRRALYSPQQRTPDAAKPLVDAVAAGSMGAGAPAAPAPAAVAPPPDAVAPEEQVIPASVPYDQIPAYLQQIEAQKAKAGEKQAVSEQWTQQKSALQQRLAQAFPDAPIPGTKTTQLEAIARAILGGEYVEDKEALDAEGSPVVMDADVYALNKAGLAPIETAFSETGNQRTGLQGVSNRELAKAWPRTSSPSALIPRQPSPRLSTKEMSQGNQSC
jgi:hypothetical protein